VCRRTEAQALPVDLPLTQTHLSNHWAIRIGCPLTAAELQPGEVVWGKTWTRRS
jgi:hypothetical protein